MFLNILNPQSSNATFIIKKIVRVSEPPTGFISDIFPREDLSGRMFVCEIVTVHLELSAEVGPLNLSIND